jgi:probable H4MPT-linked C1 transfer pathway protein
MVMAGRVLGWDIGGAHLKLAVVGDGRAIAVRQVPCPLWRGLDRLTAAVEETLSAAPRCSSHAVTMTGEMADLFPDRATGVRAIVDTLAARFGEAAGAVSFYAVDAGFLDASAARGAPERVASANWHATATFAAGRIGYGLLVDIGSTTTDLVPFRAARPAVRGITDAERLASEELVYTGVVRTPVMALVRDVPFAGERVGVMAELFATMADVHRLTGALPPHADQQETVDGRGKSLAESRARLARMIGRDEADAPASAWTALARTIAGRQVESMQHAAERVISGVGVPEDAPLVGAGIGRFLVPEIARRLGRPYRNFADLVNATDPDLADAAADAAPAASLALLAAVAAAKLA